MALAIALYESARSTRPGSPSEADRRRALEETLRFRRLLDRGPMSALGDLLRALAPVLDAQVEGWFVFGAQAVAVRGAPRATQDVDITVKIARAKLPELIDAVAAVGLSPRFPDLAEELLSQGAVIPLFHEASLMEVDLVIAGAGLEELALSRATRVSLDGGSAPPRSALPLHRPFPDHLAARPRWRSLILLGQRGGLGSRSQHGLQTSMDARAEEAG
ncbi:MAG: hypothetical protein CME06_06550 [Gemmatimonadetes bacterium]|nr:hypothetical protein [Gemmatimonadota bacterium]